MQHGLLLAATIALTAHANAQGSATIFGTVTDATGAPVPNAIIAVTDDATQQVRRIASSGDGNYAVPGLAPGAYSLAAEAPGFGQYLEKNIVLQVGENRSDSIKLPVSSTTQNVTVSGTTAQVDTRSATISEVVDSARVEQLPLNGRNALQLQSLVAGAGATSSGGGGQAENNVTAINGARQAENGYTLDGADNEDFFFFTPSVFPNPDALAEFRLDTSNYGAQGGLGSGAQMYAVTRSGTNNFHGSAFEYLRNQLFDAKGYFGKTVPPFHQNQFGGTVGGPILRNRLFFFFAYQGTRQSSSPNAETLTVPDAAERTGNFAELAAQLHYPGTTQAVAGNVFPSASLNPASLAFLKAFVPLPNSAKNIYSYSAHSLLNDDQYIGRLDHTLSSRDQLSGRILQDRNLQDQVPSTNDLPGFAANIAYTNWNLAANETHIFSSYLLNQFTFAWNDIQRVQTPEIPSQTTWGDLGAGVVRAATGPVGYDTEVQTYFTAESRWPLSQYRHSFQYSDAVSWTHNAHTVTFGGDLRRSYTHQFQDYIADGQFIFSAVYTGNQLADFETGHEQTFTQDSYNAGEPVNLTPDLFVQDDCKITRRLTLNPGLRWNPFVPYRDNLNAVSQFRAGQQSTIYLTAPVGYVFPGDAGIPQNTINARWRDVGPRLGFAYDVFGNGKTSVRAGYGVYYGFVREQSLNNLSSNQPFGIALSVSEPAGGMTNPYSSTGNPFPYAPPQTQQQKQNYAFDLPLTLTVWAPSFRDGRVEQWNANVQQQAAGWVFTLAYIGSVGEHLFLQYEGDPAVYGKPGNSTAARRVYAPYFGSITTQFSGGHSTYHALQFTANRRLSKGLTVLANYTWSKSLDNGSSDTSSPYDPFNISTNRGLSDFDIPQSLVASFVWDMPNLAKGDRLTRTALNGWQTTGILTLQRGIPFSVTSGVDNSQSGVGADLADIIGNPHLNRGSSRAAQVAEFFNTKAYKVNAVGTFGDSGRNSLLGPGIENLDFAVMKNLYTHESVKTLFRAEAFNLFNHTDLGQPVSNASSSSFGQINSLNANSTPRVLQLALRAEF